MSDEDYSDSIGYSLPLSQEAKAVGVQWLMGDGIRTPEEARDLEKIFVESLENLTFEDIRREQEKANQLRGKLKDLGIPDSL